MLKALLPFRRSMSHRTFGSLRSARSGRFWKARMPLCPASGPVDVHIQGDNGPTDAQEKLYLQIAEHYPKVLKAALSAVHKEYQRVLIAQPQLKWPAIPAPADLLKLVPLQGVWLDDHAGHKFVLSFQHTRQKDHEFHVFFKNGKLESVSFEC